MALAVFGRNTRSFVAFSLLGAANTVAPFIIFSSSYLIIPFPRFIVLLIQSIPAFTSQLLLPHVLPHIPPWLRPCLLAGCWIIAAVITSATPPNVPPPARVFATVLASAAAATTQIIFLARSRFYGRAGLAGWGLGTGLGEALVSIMPFVLTMRMGMFLRSAVDFVYYLAILVLVAYFILLPATTPAGFISPPTPRKSDLSISEQFTTLTLSPHRLSMSTPRTFKFLGSVARSYMIPLFLAFTLQSMIYPGLTRAQHTSPVFATFLAYSAAFGFATQLGCLIARSSILILALHRRRRLLFIIFVCAALLLFNTIFSLPSTVLWPMALAFCAGSASGALYINIYAKATEQLGISTLNPDSDFTISLLAFGETAGLLVGALLGHLVENRLCDVNRAPELRWCFYAR